MLLTSNLKGPLAITSSGLKFVNSCKSCLPSGSLTVLPPLKRSCTRFAHGPYVTSDIVFVRSTYRCTTVEGCFMWKLTVLASGASILSTYFQTLWDMRRMHQKVLTTSFEVKSLPSLHFAPLRSVTEKVSVPTNFHSV